MENGFPYYFQIVPSLLQYRMDFTNLIQWIGVGGDYMSTKRSIFLDMDECGLGTHTCSVDGICTNNIGSYTCRCKAGFSGNGRICTGIDLLC